MFTGIVETIGRIERIAPSAIDLRLVVSVGEIEPVTLAVGDSLSVSGVCLTVVEHTREGVLLDVSGETLGCSIIGDYHVGTRVNLERAATPTTRLGGHIVSGHVDGVARLAQRQEDGRSVRMAFDAPCALGRYIAVKGSVCVDGVSLTVNSVDDLDAVTRFEINLVPHTLEATTLSDRTVDDGVHLEVDLVARYLERMNGDSS